MGDYENMSMTQLVKEYKKLKQYCVILETEISTSKTDISDYYAKITELKVDILKAKGKAEKDIKDVEQNYKGMFGFRITKDGKDKIDDIEEQLDKDLKQFDGQIDKLDEDLKKEEEKLADREEKIKNAKAELEKIRDEAYKFKEVQEVTKTEIAEKTEEQNKPFEKLDITFKEIVSNPFDNIQKKNKDYNNFFSVEDIEVKQNELFKEDDFTSSYNNKTDDEKDELKNEIVNSAIRIYEVGNNNLKKLDLLNKDENTMLDNINDILGIKSKLEDIKKNNAEIESKIEDRKKLKKEIQEKRNKIEELKDNFAAGKISQQDKDDKIQDLKDEIQDKQKDRDDLKTKIEDLEKTNLRLEDEIEDLKKDANKKIKQEIKDELNNNIKSKLDISKLYDIEKKNLEDQLHEMQYRDYNELQSQEIKEKNLPDDQKTNILTEDMKKEVVKNGEEAIKYIMLENQDKINDLVNEIKSHENSDIELGIKRYLIRTSGINNEQVISSSKFNELEDLDIKDLLEQYILDYSKLENKQDITKVKDNYERTIQKLKDEIQKLSQVKNQPNQNGPNQNQPNQGSQTQTQQQAQAQPSQGNHTKQQTQGGSYYGSTPGNPNLNPLINLPQKQKKGLLGRFWNGIKSRFKSGAQNQPTQGNANSGRQTRPASNQTQTQSQTQTQNATSQTSQKDQDQDLREMKQGELDQKMRDEIIEMFKEQIKEEVDKNKKEAEKELDIGN